MIFVSFEIRAVSGQLDVLVVSDTFVSAYKLLRPNTFLVFYTIFKNERFKNDFAINRLKYDIFAYIKI